jgi:hypothetical protein
LSLTNEDVGELLEKFDRDSKAIKQDLLTLCWFMRGSITYDDAMMLTHDDRSVINKIIKDNLETTEKTGLAFF